MSTSSAEFGNNFVVPTSDPTEPANLLEATPLPAHRGVSYCECMQDVEQDRLHAQYTQASGFRV